MNIAHAKKQFSDKLSICLSLCCILHCIALPVIILMIPSFASLWINNEKVHIILVLFAIPVSLFAMAKSLRIHHSYKCISLAVVGLSLLVLAIFMHNINFSGEHGNSKHGEAIHHQEAEQEEATHHKKLEHEEVFDHEEAGHSHHEHDGIGETLETIFTVLGGLILLGSHYFNIRLTRKAV